MQILIIAAIVILSFLPSTWAADPALPPDFDSDNPGFLREEVRFLEHEIKSAAQPQTYIVIDLADNAVLIKARGIILHRLPIEESSPIPPPSGTVTYHLLERPPVSRRKIDPALAMEQAPISLDDMPTEFSLRLAPPLNIRIKSSSTNLLDKLASGSRQLWIQITRWSRVLATGNSEPDDPILLLILAPDYARSLAWSVTEGMPVLVRRASQTPPRP